MLCCLHRPPAGHGRPAFWTASHQGLSRDPPDGAVLRVGQQEARAPRAYPFVPERPSQVRHVLFELSVDMVRLVSWPVLTSGLASRAATVVALAFMLRNSTLALESVENGWRNPG